MTVALTEALRVYEQRGRFTKSERFSAARMLGGLGVFSYRQIGAIVGLSHTTVARLVRKKARTGGRFSPESLAPLLEMSRRRAKGEDLSVDALRAMLEAGSGTSITFAARLGDISESYIRRRVE